jgi:hypothetical protein
MNTKNLKSSRHFFGVTKPIFFFPSWLVKQSKSNYCGTQTISVLIFLSQDIGYSLEIIALKKQSLCQKLRDHEWGECYIWLEFSPASWFRAFHEFRGRIQSKELIVIKCSRPNNPRFIGGDFPYLWIICSSWRCWLFWLHQSLTNKIADLFIVIVWSQGRWKSWQQCRLWRSYGSEIKNFSSVNTASGYLSVCLRLIMMCCNVVIDSKSLALSVHIAALSWDHRPLQQRERTPSIATAMISRWTTKILRNYKEYRHCTFASNRILDNSIRRLDFPWILLSFTSVYLINCGVQ